MIICKLKEDFRKDWASKLPPVSIYKAIKIKGRSRIKYDYQLIHKYFDNGHFLVREEELEWIKTMDEYMAETEF